MDRWHFLSLLAKLPERFGSLLHSYALMDNHYHLVIETPDPVLSRLGHWLNGSYTNWFNRRHSRIGHLFQGRFKSHLIETDAGLLEVVRYVHLNPARTEQLGLSKADRESQKGCDATAPSDALIQERLRTLRAHRWSSYPAYRGWVSQPKWLTTDLIAGFFGERDTAQQRRELARYMEAPLREGVMESPWERLVGGVVFGTDDFAAKLTKTLKGNRQEQTALRVIQSQVTWGEIVRTVEQAKGEEWSKFCGRRGDWGRDAALLLGRLRGRLSLSELAQLAGGIGYSAAGAAIKRFEKRLLAEKPLNILFGELESRLSNVET